MIVLSGNLSRLVEEDNVRIKKKVASHVQPLLFSHLLLAILLGQPLSVFVFVFVFVLFFVSPAAPDPPWSAPPPPQDHPRAGGGSSSASG